MGKRIWKMLNVELAPEGPEAKRFVAGVAAGAAIVILVFRYWFGG